MKDPEILINRESSLTRITPLTAEARDWVEANCQWEEYQKLGGSYVCDWRMADPIIEAMREAGFEVEE